MAGFRHSGRLVKILSTKLRKKGVLMLLIIITATLSLVYIIFSNHNVQDISQDAVSDHKSSISNDATNSIITTTKEETEISSSISTTAENETQDEKESEDSTSDGDGEESEDTTSDEDEHESEDTTSDEDEQESEDTSSDEDEVEDEEGEQSVWDDKFCVLQEEDDSEEYYNRDKQKAEKTGKSKPNQDINLGRCRYDYPTRSPPENDHENAYLGGIDFFFFRKEHKKREKCFLECIDRLKKDEIDDNLLVEAAIMGLTQVAKKLKAKYNLNPLKPSDFINRPRLNAIQEAIRGGYAEVVQILSDSNNDLVIDNLGRTVKDNVTMKGSAILPKDAKTYLNLDTPSKSSRLRRRPKAKDSVKKALKETGWLYDPKLVPSERCDIDILGDITLEQFYNDYFLPGRPFVLRGQVPQEEIRAFDKSRWESTKRFNSNVEVSVGPSAYPRLTGQEKCKKSFKISDVEKGKECEEQPGIPMIHSRQPAWDDLDELYPRYDGDIYDDAGGFRFLRQWFGKGVDTDNNWSWQFSFGGDDSGATLHWHEAAVNALYVGVKDWIITPPLHRGMTGKPARNASKIMDESISLRCTQLPGDLMYIPDSWGHLTINRGFCIDAELVLTRDMQKAARAMQKSISAGAVKSKGVKPVTNDGKKLFFVHINKAGGTSMIRMLTNRCQSQYFSGSWGDGKRSFHASVRQFIDHYGRYEWDSAHSFAVVRHPMARQVSNFFFLVGNCAENGKKSVCKERLIPLNMDLDTLSDEEKIEAFHAYTAKLYKKYPPESKEHYLFGSRGHGNEDYNTFNATQTSWLVDENDSIIVKEIFHLEDLSNDMSKLADKFPCLKGKNSKTTASKRSLKEEVDMIHMNASPKYPDYRLFGKNKLTNRIIKEVYEVDFRNFGCKL